MNNTKCNIKPNKDIETPNAIPYELRATKTEPMLCAPVNGGLYGGPQVNHPWMPINVIPTATNLTYNNLRSANPPPGATTQFIGTIRQGNNYIAMPEVKAYTDSHPVNCGPFNIHGL
jgi:hypothetical protein